MNNIQLQYVAYTISGVCRHTDLPNRKTVDQISIIFDVGPAKSEIANRNPVCQLENIQYNIKLILAYCQMLPCGLSVVERN